MTQLSGKPTDLISKIPMFHRRDFVSGDGAAAAPNPWSDMIVCTGTADNPIAVPVGVVSKRYRLVQQRDLFQCAIRAMEAHEVPVNDVACNLRLSPHGERMVFFMALPPEHFIDPGDGHPMTLRLCGYNSVDCSSSLAVYVGWFRLICSNGMVVGVTWGEACQIHTPRLDFSSIAAVLSDGIRQADGDSRRFSRWHKTVIPDDRLARWADNSLTGQWGVKAAARTLHIVRTGMDADFADPFESGPASKRRMKPTGPVPGATDEPNAYAVSQALSWLASHRADVRDQLARTRQIPGLMRSLVGKRNLLN